LDAHGTPNELEGGASEASAEAAPSSDAALDVTVDAPKDVAVSSEAGPDVTVADVGAADVGAADVATDVAADVTNDVANDVAQDATPVDAKVLDAFPDVGFVLPDASNDSGGSTAACEECAITSCGTQTLGCLGDTACSTAVTTLKTCLTNVGGDGGTTVVGCLTTLAASADAPTLALGTCLVTSCTTACGVPAGFDAGH
jgi:hypothetical protein